MKFNKTCIILAIPIILIILITLTSIILSSFTIIPEIIKTLTNGYTYTKEMQLDYSFLMTRSEFLTRMNTNQRLMRAILDVNELNKNQRIKLKSK